MMYKSAWMVLMEGADPSLLETLMHELESIAPKIGPSWLDHLVWGGAMIGVEWSYNSVQ